MPSLYWSWWTPKRVCEHRFTELRSDEFKKKVYNVVHFMAASHLEYLEIARYYHGNIEQGNRWTRESSRGHFSPVHIESGIGKSL